MYRSKRLIELYSIGKRKLVNQTFRVIANKFQFQIKKRVKCVIDVTKIRRNV